MFFTKLFYIVYSKLIFKIMTNLKTIFNLSCFRIVFNLLNINYLSLSVFFTISSNVFIKSLFILFFSKLNNL